MAMQNVEYQGYGVDLGDYSSSNKVYQSVVNTLIEFFADLTEEGSEHFIVPCNTDNFEALVLIPAVIPVAISEVKVYSEQEANETLAKWINETIWQMLESYADGKLEDEISDCLSKINFKNIDIKDFQKEIESFVNEYADYSYERDWSDLI